MEIYAVQFWGNTDNFIKELPRKLQAKVKEEISCMKRNDFRAVRVKTLRGPIGELKVKRYRLLFFIYGSTIFFAGAFVKKTEKTPRAELEKAENIYRMIINYK